MLAATAFLCAFAFTGWVPPWSALAAVVPFGSVAIALLTALHLAIGLARVLDRRGDAGVLGVAEAAVRARRADAADSSSIPPIMQRLAAFTPFPGILAGPASFVLDGEAVAGRVLVVRLAMWCVATASRSCSGCYARTTRADREWWVRRQMRAISKLDLRFAAALLATNLKASLMLRGAFAMQVVFMALNNFTFFVFWWVLMRRVPEIRGWRLTDIEAAVRHRRGGGRARHHRGRRRAVSRSVHRTRRAGYAAASSRRRCSCTPSGCDRNPRGSATWCPDSILIALSGQVSWIDTPRVVVAIVAAALVFAASGILFFSVAFWLGKSDTVARQMWELVITFSLYPEPLFGGVLRLVLFTLIPAAWVGYMPAHIARHASAGQLLLLASAAAGYLVLAAVMFQRGLRRYASGSRFGVFG